MNTITKLFTLLFTFTSSIIASQESKNEIEKTFYAYLNTLINKEFKESMNYISDDFFTIIPKEQMIVAVENTFNNPDIEFEIKDPRIISVNDAEIIENKYYSLLTYSNKINMKFKRNEEKQETEDDYKSRMNLMKPALEQTFGQQNVSFNEQTSIFEIYSEKKVYAISLNGQTQWKFLVLEKNQKPLLEKLLPKILIDRM